MTEPEHETRESPANPAPARTAAESVADPMYFGADSRPLFGWFHRPTGEWSGTRVVVCAPLGYEGLFAHPSIRALSIALSGDAQAAVLRFDYRNTGDSAGIDEDPGQVAAWLESVDTAIDEIKRLAPSDGPLVVVGIRAGATLAASAVANRDDVDALVLWAPVMTGREFAREQRAFSLLAHATAAGPDAEPISWGEGGFEANGYVFSGETVKALGELNIGKKAPPAGSRVLLLDREESPVSEKSLEPWRSANVPLDRVTIGDFPGMLEPPTIVKIPTDSIARIVAWVEELPAADGARPQPIPTPAPRTEAEVAPGVVERAVWYDGANGGLFGILTAPMASRPARVMVFLNNASGYRVGPHAMVPMMARELARHGIGSFRLDLAGVGDSALPQGRAPHHPYHLDAVGDVEQALGYLGAQGFRNIAAGGLCSAAFVAYHSARQSNAIDRLVMMNPQTFTWTEGDSLDVSPLQDEYDMNHYKAAVRSREKWLKLLKGQVAFGHIARLVRDRAILAVTSRLLSVRTRLGVGGSSSPVGKIVQALGERGGHVAFIFSGRDPGIVNLNEELAGSIGGLQDRGYLRLNVIQGPDHSFTPRWATRRLTEAVLNALRDR